MWIVIIVCIVIFVATLGSAYAIVWGSFSPEEYFFVKHFFIQFISFLTAVYLIYWMGKNEDSEYTKAERVLKDISGYLLLITVVINLIALLIVVVKGLSQ